MDIVIDSLLEGARRATGSVVIIDVLRAFTTAAVALANGASQIIMVRAVEEALALRRDGVGQICLGENGGRAPPGFDFGNSPFEIAAIDFRGQILIQRSAAGTQGIVAASGAERLYAGALVTAKATSRALLRGTPERITLVGMGDNAASRSDEDELCALHLRNLLQGRPSDPGALRQLILASGPAARFRDPTRPYFHPRDLELALDIDRYDFAVRVTVEEGRPVARIERPI